MIDVFTESTPKGWKASIALEELELPYAVHPMNLSEGQQNELVRHAGQARNVRN
jgi:GSH-dependent disulfide-bond oxidoreductase